MSAEQMLDKSTISERHNPILTPVFWSIPDLNPRFSRYMSYGAVVTEAEVDVLTGDWRILRADILLDCGKSLNPAIDVGQVQGGYVMGLGNFLCEEMLYDDRGKNISDTSWEYKASPDFRHVPSTDVYEFKPFLNLFRI
jgi:xanthine dehydrogenase molybdopterin-binding subunit B